MSYGYLLISKLKESWVIDYGKSEKPICSIFAPYRHREDNQFFEYYLNQASITPKYLKEKHEALGVDEFGYLFIEVVLSNQYDDGKLVEDLFDETIGDIEKSKLVNNIYSFTNRSLVVDIEGLLMCCSERYPYIRNVSGRFFEEEAKSIYDQDCTNSMLYWHQMDEENSRGPVIEAANNIKEIFSNNSEFQRIKKTIVDIYMYERSTGIKSIFDSKAKSIQSEVEAIKNRYRSIFPAKNNLFISEITLVAYGFNSVDALICAGFLRSLYSHQDLNDWHNWVDFDLWIHIAFKRSGTFGDAINALVYEQYWNSTPLLQFAPLREFIPDGFFLPSEDYKSYTDIPFKVRKFNHLQDTFDSTDILSIRNKYGWKKVRGQSIEEFVIDGKL